MVFVGSGELLRNPGFGTVSVTLSSFSGHAKKKMFNLF